MGATIVCLFEWHVNMEIFFFLIVYINIYIFIIPNFQRVNLGLPGEACVSQRGLALNTCEAF